MKYYFIRCESSKEGEESILHLWGRDLSTKQKHHFKIVGFEHYFYILESEPCQLNTVVKSITTGFISIFREPVKRLTLYRPEDAYDYKRQFTKTYEADVSYIVRFLIDKQIRKYFTIENNNTTDYIHHSNIKGE